MKKLSKLFRTILAGALFCITFASCENFMNGGDIRKEIQDAIAEANASNIEVTIKPDEGTGTTIPYGLYGAKVGYSFKVSFTESKQYCFKQWKAVFLNNGKEVTDGIKFEDVYSLETKVTVLTKDNIKIYPECIERITIQGEPSPKYEPNGVSRDRPILIRFSKPLAPESFIFSEEEIAKLPENAVINKTLEGGKEVVYSYSIPQEDGSNIKYFKNISITNEYDYSLASHFSSPVIEDGLLSISVDKNSPIVFDDNETKKVIKVTLSGAIYGKNDIAPMLTDYSWNYIITPETDEKAIVEFRCNSTFGNNSKTFSIGSKIPVSYIEEGDYQFIKWVYDSSVLDVDDATKKDAVFLVKEKTSEHGIVVTAETKIIGKLSSIKPAYSDFGVSRNSAIEITFNKPMNPNTIELGYSLMITETYDQTVHYEDYFEEPEWDGNTVIIKPIFEIKDLLKSNTDQKNLMITLIAEEIIDEEGNPILTSDYTHIYRINYSTETLGPEFTLSVYKPNLDSDYQLITDDDDEMTYETITDKKFEDFSLTSDKSEKNPYGDFSKNHIKDTVYFDYEAYDEESGFEKFSVKETWLADYTYEYDYDDNYWDADSFIEYPITLTRPYSDGEKIKYKLQSLYDGVVKLDFIFADRANNESVKTIYVLKDTTLNDNSLKTEEMTVISTESMSISYTVNGESKILPSNKASKFTSTGLTQIQNLMPPSNTNEVGQTLTFNYATVADRFAYYDFGISSINLKYTVLYGESEDNLTEADSEFIDNGQRLRFSFPRNIKKDCFIKITVTDPVGNTRTETRIIPGQLSIMGDKYKNDNWAGGNYEHIKLGRYEEFTRLISTYTDATYGFYYFFPDANNTYKILKLNQTTSYLENTRPRFYWSYNYEGVTIPQSVFAPYGKYECYLLPFYKYGSQFYYGTISKGYYYFNSSSTVETFTGAALPTNKNQFECILDNSIPNLGYRTGHITFKNGFAPTSGYEYGIQYDPVGVSSGGASNNNSGYSGLDFAIPSGYKYNIYIYAQSPTGGRVVSSVSNLVDATYDNIPPTMVELTADLQKYRSRSLHGPDITKLYITDNSSLQQFFPRDDGSGIKKVVGKPGYCEFEYCITPYTGDMVFLTNEDFEKRKSKNEVFRAEYQEGAESLILDFNGVYNQGNSVVTFKVYDNCNNFLIYNLNVNLTSKFDVNILDHLTIGDGTNFNTQWNSAYGEAGTLWLWSPNNYRSVITFGIKDDKWEFINESPNIVRHYMTTVEKDIYDNCIFMSCAVTPTGSNSCSLGSDINYLCKEYELKRIAGENMENYCKSKGVISAYGGGYQIFYDAPCFVHTMAFPTDKLDYIQQQMKSHSYVLKNEYQAWDSIGREYGVKVLNSDFSSGTTTYYPPVEDIPSGYSYVTIVHFADRTAVMGEVKQKP